MLDKFKDFVRFSIRPTASFLTLYFDYKCFLTTSKYDADQMDLLLLLNTVVLVFWFGERVIKNVTPVLSEFFARKNGH